MRGIVWLILLFIVAVVAATTLGSNDGVVSIYWRHWRTDLSINLFVLLLVGSYLVLATAMQALTRLLALPKRAREWRELRTERAAQVALREALAEYFAARYSRAQRAAQRALNLSEGVPLLRKDTEFQTLACLLAAGSSHRLQDRRRRDDWLARLQSQQPAARPLRAAGEGAALLAVEWAVEDRDPQAALERLAALPAGLARRTQALRLNLQTARLSKRPLQALHTARQLANHQAFSKVVAQGLTRSLANEALETAHDADQLRGTWQQFEAADRRDPVVAARAAQRACVLDDLQMARQWLRPLWDRLDEHSPEDRALISLALMDAAAGIDGDWLPSMERALSSYANEPAVVAAVGAVFVERQLWGKASRALALAAAAPQLASLARRRCWRLLAKLARQEGDEAKAQQCEFAAAQID